MHPALNSWLKCKACPLYESARHHVLGRGKLPCQILFVGEGPGVSEDEIGQAFVGASGKLLQLAVNEALPGIKVAYTNLVACRPCDSRNSPNRPPEDYERQACADRLAMTIQLARAKGIVLLGRQAQQYAGTMAMKTMGGWDRVMFQPHPAWLLRMGGVRARQYSAYCEALLDFVLRIGLNPRRKVVGNENSQGRDQDSGKATIVFVRKKKPPQ